MKRNNSNKTERIQLIGIPVILVAVLLYVFTISYQPQHQELPYGEIIYSSDRYEASEKSDWHKIDFSSFSIEVPKAFHFYLGQGVHGGKVGGITNSKDTIRFVHGAYYFDACEGIVIGEVIGTCDTLAIFDLTSKKLIVTQTDSYIGAFAKDPKDGSVFKAWGDLNVDQNFLFDVFKTVEIKN